jgi:electron transfer flavoprotein beta subunit
MSTGLHIVVCGSVVPDPLQTLEPVVTPQGHGLKNEMMLPNVLDPWAGHALFEAAELAKKVPESKVWLVSLGPKPKLQQVMMTIAQKVPFELVAVDGPASGFVESHEVAAHLNKAINSIPTLNKERMLLFGGWESASRGSGSTMQILGEMQGITEQFQGVDELKYFNDTLSVLERVEGGKHQSSTCVGLPVLLGWATGNLPEPPNNPQVGMMNMRTIMPSIQRSQPVQVKNEGMVIDKVELPESRRVTRVEKDMTTDEIAREIVEWTKQV